MDGRVRFSEVDEFGYLRCENIVNYFQDCSTFQSEDLGVGVDYLKERGIAWVVTSWQVEILKYPKLGDRIKIGTFAYEFKSFLGNRNFYMLDESGDYIAKASSVWILLNTTTGRPEKANDEQKTKYGTEERLEMDYKHRKISIPDDMKRLDEIEVTEHLLDVNHHVNNGQYIRIAAKCIEGMERPKSLRVEYKNQARLSDIIIPYTNGEIVDLRGLDGSSYCVIEVS